MKFPPDYYHCFLGNGLDAVLIGYTGSMVEDRAQGLDRCYWYKSDRYYPEHRLVLPVPNRYSSQRTPIPRAADTGWCELAPLGHSWYALYQDGRELQIKGFSQHFVAEEATLYSEVDYGALRARVTTFLHGQWPLLVERYEFDQEVDFRAFMEPGVWCEEGYETEPLSDLQWAEGEARCRYRLGEIHGYQALALEPPAEAWGREGRRLWLRHRGRVMTKYYTIVDDKDGPLTTEVLDRARDLGYEQLRQSHLAAWAEYFSRSTIHIPEADFEKLYRSSYHAFKAMQNPVSGGLPVNNLRLTWSSHVFWDSYYIYRALLEGNRLAEAREACRFLQRTLPAAERHAREDFATEGLKWDWELTHDGRPAYGPYVHQKEQVHNNAAYANQIWQYYQFTRDSEFLAEFYPILEGIARFFMQAVVQETERGYGTRPLVGVHESPQRVSNEGITLAGTVRILRNLASAARALGWDSDFTARCQTVAEGLMRTLDGLYNGRYFRSAEGVDHLNMSSLAPIYPMELYPYNDPRALSTAQAYQQRYAGRMVGHGGSEKGFPWSAGVLAIIFARQGEVEGAWQIIEGTRPAICGHGGLAETVDAEGRWNMQYFGTAQGAVCTAINSLLLQARADELHLFPAVPPGWPECRFENLLAAGCLVSAALDCSIGQVESSIRNITGERVLRTVHLGSQAISVELEPQEERAFSFVAESFGSQRR